MCFVCVRTYVCVVCVHVHVCACVVHEYNYECTHVISVIIGNDCVVYILLELLWTYVRLILFNVHSHAHY